MICWPIFWCLRLYCHCADFVSHFYDSSGSILRGSRVDRSQYRLGPVFNKVTLPIFGWRRAVDPFEVSDVVTLIAEPGHYGNFLNSPKRAGKKVSRILHLGKLYGTRGGSAGFFLKQMA